MDDVTIYDIAVSRTARHGWVARVTHHPAGLPVVVRFFELASLSVLAKVMQPIKGLLDRQNRRWRSCTNRLNAPRF
jgi:hypothetical protein